MPPKYQIVEGKAYHVGRICRALRPDHSAAIDSLHLNAHAALADTFHRSAFCRAAIMDGKVAAMWGVTGMMLSPTGIVWLALSDDAAKLPVIVAREAKRQLAVMMATRDEIMTVLVLSDAKSVRLARFLGFTIEPQPDNKVAAAILIKERRRIMAPSSQARH